MARQAPANRAIERALRIGLARMGAGKASEAEACYRRVLEIDPEHAVSYRLLGQACEIQGNAHAAIQSYRRALSLNPEDAEGMHRLANLLSDAGAMDEAVALFERLLQLAPGDARVHYDHGRLRKRRGEWQAAVNCYRRAVELRPDSFEIHFNLASALFHAGRVAESESSYQEALRLQPDNAEAHYALGVELHESAHYQAAAVSFANALRLKPDFAEALCNLGMATIELGDLPMAVRFIRRAITLQPNTANFHCNLGKALLRQGDTLAALGAFRNTLALQSDHPAALTNLGFTLETLGDHDSAAQCYRLALKSQPDLVLARFFLGMRQLADGDFAAGWPAYEHRWVSKDCRRFRREFRQPQWRGEDIQGSRILLYAEQGLGDTMQFVRYLPMLQARGAEIVLEVQPNVYRLLKNCFEQPGVRVIRVGESQPDFEWQCPLMSLPLAFGTDLASIPSGVPYLHAEAAAATHWAKRLSTDTLRVGIVWAGNPKHSREVQRSVPLEQLARLTQIEGATFYSLQKGAAAALLNTPTSGLHLIDLDAEQEDFADTAAIASNLDLVISIDTSVAHLAGAMGRPVWILLHHLPDWRWMRGCSNSPWYPTARLVRQTAPGDWSGVLSQLEENLRALVNSREHAPKRSNR